MNKDKTIIFLVDDDALFLRALEIEFIQNTDFKIETFATGELCIDNLSSSPDIIILDYRLDYLDKNAMNGVEALDKIKAFNSNISVVMLSSQDKIDVAVTCVNHSAFDYIVKSETTFVRLQKSIMEIKKRAEELILAERDALQKREKEKRDAELIIANKELAFQNQEKEKKAQEFIIRNKELTFQNEEKEKRTAELSSQKKQLEDFCNIISHNLRAPLVNIGMLVDFLIKSTDPDQQELLKEQLSISSAILNEIFNELVESLQVRQDTEIKSEKIILHEYAQRSIDALKGQINKSQAVIETNFENCPEIYFPEKYITSIFHNLISNALKYESPERKPIIKIGTKIVKGNIILSVSDNGLGIDLKKHKDNMFKIRKVFHSHPDAKGFGLFITKSHVDAMGGSIWVESIPGVGSTFFIEFKNHNICQPLNA